MYKVLYIIYLKLYQVYYVFLKVRLLVRYIWDISMSKFPTHSNSLCSGVNPVGDPNSKLGPGGQI